MVFIISGEYTEVGSGDVGHTLRSSRQEAAGGICGAAGEGAGASYQVSWVNLIGNLKEGKARCFGAALLLDHAFACLGVLKGQGAVGGAQGKHPEQVTRRVFLFLGGDLFLGSCSSRRQGFTM